MRSILAAQPINYTVNTWYPTSEIVCAESQVRTIGQDALFESRYCKAVRLRREDCSMNEMSSVQRVWKREGFKCIMLASMSGHPYSCRRMFYTMTS